MPAVPAPTAIPKPAIALASAAVISIVEVGPVESDVKVKTSLAREAVAPADAAVSAALISSSTSAAGELLLLSVILRG